MHAAIVEANGRGQSDRVARWEVDVGMVQGAGVDDVDPVGAAIARMLRALPEPVWDEARANRLFERVMEAVARRERRRRRAQWAVAALSTLLAAVSVPRIARRLRG